MSQPEEPLTRAMVARRLGKSVGAVRFQEGKTLHPRQDADGVWRFDPVEVEALAQKLRPSAKGQEESMDLPRGKLAARACQLFREGKSVVDVVIALEQPFDIVQPLYRSFLEDGAGMHLPATIVERLMAICEVDKLTPEVLLHILEENSRKLAQLSVDLHGGRLGSSESQRSRK